MDVKLPDDLHNQLQGLKYEAKWPVLKPVLEPLYHTKEVSEIAFMIKKKYHFDANNTKTSSESGSGKKHVSSETKDQMLAIAKTRGKFGKRTAVTYHDVPVDLKKLKRYANAIAQEHLVIPESSTRSVEGQTHILGSFLSFGNRLFVNWSMPFGIGPPAWNPQVPVSPRPDFAFDTPGSFHVQTPLEHVDSPRDAHSPFNAPSPLSAAIITRASAIRTNLFLQGRFAELIRSMNNNEKSTMSLWLYQFWYFCFKTSKNWGRDVRPLTADQLEFDRYNNIRIENLPFTISHLSPNSSRVEEEIPAPSGLCHWSIHLSPRGGAIEFDETDNMESATRNSQRQTPSLEQMLSDSLAVNDFSTIPSANLPLAVSKIAGAMQQSAEVLLEESFAFAIMARNSELVAELIPKLKRAGLNLSNLSPFHIATSYLDGGKTCCTMLDLMLGSFDFGLAKSLTYNNHGHTVLDNLMLIILRSHSTANIGDADTSLKQNARYAGIEVDICGRWDADSPCFRALAMSGVTAIPKRWKHKFCHTSIQAVCHCIAILGMHGQLQRSGLFLKLCHHCGMRLQLSPLHTLIMIGYVLANNCCQGEDLFGIIACFLCLVANGIDPSITASISISSLLGQSDDDEVCDHKDVTACKLAETLTAFLSVQWPSELRTGWQLLCKITELATFGYEPRSEEDTEALLDEASHDVGEGYEKTCDEHLDCYELTFGSDLQLGHVWAAVQTELLNYHRIHEHDPWLSENFDMARLLHSLEAEERPAIGYVERGLILPYCRCGLFDTPYFPLREEVSKG